MRTKIAVDLATGHGGDLGVAERMIRAAAEAGADAVKIQHYGSVNPKDPQAAWLEQSRLSPTTIAHLMDVARGCHVEFWATPFDRTTLDVLCGLNVDRVKIASTEARNDWWKTYDALSRLVVSWPWGVKDQKITDGLHLIAIPLYPTPLECVGRAEDNLDGWSDHTIGVSTCQLCIVNGAQWLEVHLTLGEGQSRVMSFDKTPDQIRQLRQFAEDVETMATGIGQTFRQRWVR